MTLKIMNQCYHKELLILDKLAKLNSHELTDTGTYLHNRYLSIHDSLTGNGGDEKKVFDFLYKYPYFLATFLKLNKSIRGA